MRLFLLLITCQILFFQASFAQKQVLVVDKETNEPLPYATLKFTDSENGIYTNLKGAFSLKDIETKILEVNHLGYKMETVRVKNILDTLKLEPISSKLNEVTINSTKSQPKRIGLSRKIKNISWHIQSKTELATLIKTRIKSKNAYVASIHIPIGKSTYIKENDKFISNSPVFNSVFRVSLYSNKNNKPHTRLLQNPILVSCNQDSKDIIVVNIKNEKIKYPKEGLIISVEMIGSLNAQGDITKVDALNSLPSFKFKPKTIGEIFSKSYSRTIFSKNREWALLETKDYIKSEKEYNLAVGLTLELY